MQNQPTRPYGIVAEIASGDDELAEMVTEGLADVEAALLTQVSLADELIVEQALHLVRAGGKRFRPLLTILTAHMGPEPVNPDVATAGAVVELVHLASLYHDDVMDSAHTRRGVPSANNLWDNKIAILAGDFLFARSSKLCAGLGAEAVDIIAGTYSDLVVGQVRETTGPIAGRDPVEHYRKVIWEKTGALIATAACFGGMFSGAGTEQCTRLYRLGEVMGIAFQIADDLLDICASSPVSGKAAGTDLREGIRTLPMLLALEDEGPEADRLRELLVGPLPVEAEVAEALALLNRSDGLKRARQELRGHVDRALLELHSLPDGPANRALERLVHHTVDRAS